MAVQWLPPLPQSKSGLDFDSGLSMYGLHVLSVLCKFSPPVSKTCMSGIL